MTSKIRIEIRINLSRADDVQFKQVTDDLRRRRQLSATVRDGLALILDLRAGRTDVLFALFPHLRLPAVPASVPDIVLDKPPADPYGQDFLKRLVAVVDEVAAARYWSRAA